jgi:hypothetical protein
MSLKLYGCSTSESMFSSVSLHHLQEWMGWSPDYGDYRRRDHDMLNVECKQVLELQQRLGHRFGDQTKLRAYLFGSKSDKDEQFYVCVGKAMVTSVLSPYGSDVVQQALASSEQDWAVLGLIRIDVSPKRSLAYLDKLVTRLFHVGQSAAVKPNADFSRFHNLLCRAPFHKVEKFLSEHPEIVNAHNEGSGDTPLMMVLRRQKRLGKKRRANNHMWQMVDLLVENGASWTRTNLKKQSAWDLMQEFTDDNIKRASLAACTTEDDSE